MLEEPDWCCFVYQAGLCKLASGIKAVSFEVEGHQMERLAARVLWLSEELIAAVTDSDGR